MPSHLISHDHIFVILTQRSHEEEGKLAPPSNIAFQSHEVIFNEYLPFGIIEITASPQWEHEQTLDTHQCIPLKTEIPIIRAESSQVLKCENPCNPQTP